MKRHKVIVNAEEFHSVEQGEGVSDDIPGAVRQVLEDNVCEKERVAQIQRPTLLIAEQTSPIHPLVNDGLARVCRSGQRVAVPNATHEMWSEQPDACGTAVAEFLRAHAAA